ncbi:MAG: hypothetical protein HY735_02915 [Verrucomicrobia bacterium]|nr:hypothetical protein [Verrucomicrobiota bacterium]
MKTHLNTPWAVNRYACAALVLVASLWPTFAQTNSIEPLRKPIKFSVAPIQLHTAPQAKQQTPVSRAEAVRGVSWIPITFGTVVMGFLAQEPAQYPAPTGSNRSVINAAEPRTGGATTPRDLPLGPGLVPTIQESTVRQVQLVRQRPRVSLGRDESDRALISEKPPGWVLLSIRF